MKLRSGFPAFEDSVVADHENLLNKLNLYEMEYKYLKKLELEKIDAMKVIETCLLDPKWCDLC